MLLGLLFPRRKWAIRIVEKVCKDIKTPEATEAIELIVWGVKNSPTPLPVRDRAIITAMGLVTNQTAVAQFLKEVPMTQGRAVRFLRHIRDAAVALAKEEGLEKLVEMGLRRGR